MLDMTITTERLKVSIVNSRRLNLVRARFIMLSESLKMSIEKRVDQQWKSCDCITIHQRSISVPSAFISGPGFTPLMNTNVRLD